MLNLQELFDPGRDVDIDLDAALADRPVHERRSLRWALELQSMASDHVLDLTPETADALDLIVDVALDGGFASPAHLIRAVGCYFEALIVTHLQGQYVDLGPFPMFLRVILPSDDDGWVYTSPLRLALDAWEKQRPRFGEAFSGLVEMMEEGFDRPLFVPFYEPHDLDPVLEPVWLFSQSLQVILGRFESGQWNLHMMPHNLRYVDEFMAKEPDAAMQLRLTTVSDDSREMAWWQARACAAFFGEMVREHLGGRWVAPQRGPVEMDVGGARFSPLMLCEQAMDGARGDYALLSAYQAVMDFVGSEGAMDFPLADLAPPAEPLTSGLQRVPTGEMPIYEDEDAPSTRQYDSGELQRQLAEGPSVAFDPGFEEEEQVELSTRQYNSDELQRELISQMRQQAGSQEAFEAELASADPMAQRYLTGENPAYPDDTDDLDDDDLGIEIDVDQDVIETRNVEPGDFGRAFEDIGDFDDLEDVVGDELEASLERTEESFERPELPFGDSAQETSPDKPRLYIDPDELQREMEQSGASAPVPLGEPRRSHPKTIPMSAVGEEPPSPHEAPRRPDPRTVPMSPVSPDHPLYNVQTVQGDIPAELVARLTEGEGGPGKPQMPKTQRLTEVTVGERDNPEYQQALARSREIERQPPSSGAQEVSTVAVSSSDPRLAALQRPQPDPEEGEASTVAVSSTDPRLAALHASNPDETSRADASTVAVSSSDPRLMALQRPQPDAEEGEASTVAVSSSDPRLAALRATNPDEASQEDASTRAVTSADDPRLAALRAATVGDDSGGSHEASTMAVRRNPSLAASGSFEAVERGERPLSSNSIAARTRSAPHGVLGEVYQQFRPVVVASAWPRLDEVVSAPLVDGDVPGGSPNVAIAIDYPDHLVYLNLEDLAAWSVEFEVVFQMACANLGESPADLTPFFSRLELEGADVFQLGIGDYYESSRIFLPSLATAGQSLLGTEDLIVGLPNRNILLMIRGDATDEEIARLRGVVQYCHAGKQHPLSHGLFRRRRGMVEWVP